MGITVITASYNRGRLLKTLYKSLKEQEYKDFEWIIVNDGSTDDTDKIVRNFISENILKIMLISKKNEGKHVAINCAAKRATKEWCFFVDSDDYLTSDALKLINYYLNTIKDNNMFAGVAGLKGYLKNGKIIPYVSWGNSKKNIGSRDFLKLKYLDATSVDYRVKWKIKGDRAEVIRTSLLLERPFPKFDNEKFLSERYLWDSLSIDGYKFRWFNKVVYLAEYREDGLTQNIQKVHEMNPKGELCIDKNIINNMQYPLFDRLRAMADYISIMNKNKHDWACILKKYNILFILSSLFTLLLRNSYRRVKKWKI